MKNKMITADQLRICTKKELIKNHNFMEVLSTERGKGDLSFVVGEKKFLVRFYAIKHESGPASLCALLLVRTCGPDVAHDLPFLRETYPGMDVSHDLPFLWETYPGMDDGEVANPNWSCVASITFDNTNDDLCEHDHLDVVATILKTIDEYVNEQAPKELEEQQASSQPLAPKKKVPVDLAKFNHSKIELMDSCAETIDNFEEDLADDPDSPFYKIQYGKLILYVFFPLGKEVHKHINRICGFTNSLEDVERIRRSMVPKEHHFGILSAYKTDTRSFVCSDVAFQHLAVVHGIAFDSDEIEDPIEYMLERFAESNQRIGQYRDTTPSKAKITEADGKSEEFVVEGKSKELADQMTEQANSQLSNNIDQFEELEKLRKRRDTLLEQLSQRQHSNPRAKLAQQLVLECFKQSGVGSTNHSLERVIGINVAQALAVYDEVTSEAPKSKEKE